ncbi:MAG: Co2+/Mg2+ efflux protein ApaG [Pseudomonadota bacterium]
MDNDLPYSATTRGITVRVQPVFLDDQSDPADRRYVWAYRIRIENHGGETVQLQRRHWRITDAQGQMQLVAGDGVVGEQPVLEPGGAFEYTSGAPLATPSGLMVGHYEMRSNAGEVFLIDIPAFSLDSPYERQALH